MIPISGDMGMRGGEAITTPRFMDGGGAAYPAPSTPPAPASGLIPTSPSPSPTMSPYNGFNSLTPLTPTRSPYSAVDHATPLAPTTPYRSFSSLPVTTGQGNAPAPRPVPPPAPPPFIPSNLGSPITPQFSNPLTGQVAPSVGTPTGYDLGAGVNSSVGGLLPSGFNASTMTSPAAPDAATPGASSYVNAQLGQAQGPTQWNVTPNQTVAGQYASLMSQGNPAIQAAEEAQMRATAAAGGRNSLMSQQSSMLAGSQVAMTIAQHDAQVNAQAGQFNAAQANAFAQQQDQFVQNATLSQQNFEQGVAMLKDQTNQSISQLYAQVEASAATASIGIKTQLAHTQISTNATLETMDKSFAQDNGKAWTSYGMTVRTNYLASVNTQQQSLMATIGEINGNPNITNAQASAAITQAVGEFNSFMTMNNAYYSSMMPGSATASAGQYDVANFPMG